MRADRLRTAADTFFLVILQVLADEAESGQDLVDIQPEGVRVVIGERELVLFVRQRQAFEQAYPAVDRRQAAAAVLNRTGDDLIRQRAAQADVQAEQGGV